jgi:hypothetical protein
MSKQCPKCGEVKGLDQFYNQPGKKDGKATNCKQCRQDVSNADRAANSDRYRAYARKRVFKLRLSALMHYSNNSCACCGETHIEFLAIDHIDGNGNQHRKEFNTGSGTPFYYWLKRNNYPEGFRVLCHNCNMAIGLYGKCPHEDIKETRC